ncbi:ACT domain-containing protein [Endozoicomonas acroporae]|uniref:ACT domain-containing protein n=1 Tax=Endozoicomonas acroporae TaxID=1701104 RepID=UPI003D7B52B4
MPNASLFNMTMGSEGGSLITKKNKELIVEQECGWNLIELKGPIPFEMSGILSNILKILSDANISVLVNSSYDNDYIFVKKEHLDIAVTSLRNNQFEIEMESL